MIPIPSRNTECTLILASCDPQARAAAPSTTCFTATMVISTIMVARRGKFTGAQTDAARDRVSPTTIMKKAIPGRMALFASHTLSGNSREPTPASEGFAFNWGPYFDGAHSRTPCGVDDVTETHGQRTPAAKVFK